MKILKTSLYILAILLVVYLVLCFTGPKKLEVSRSIDIKATPEMVYAQVSDFANWPAWSPWFRKEKDIENTYTGDPGTVGHMMTWKSKSMGSGKQTVTAVEANHLFKTDLVFDDWDGKSEADLMLDPSSDGTKVTWTMNGADVPFMMRGMIVIIGMTKKLEADYDEGLMHLKEICESGSANP